MYCIWALANAQTTKKDYTRQLICQPTETSIHEISQSSIGLSASWNKSLTKLDFLKPCSNFTTNSNVCIAMQELKKHVQALSANGMASYKAGMEFAFKEFITVSHLNKDSESL